MSVNRAIIVITYDGSPWIDECMASLEGVKYPIDKCDGGSTFDPMGFYRAVEKGYDEFVILHDTCVVKDIKLFDMLFDRPGHVAITMGFLMCLGKYVTKDLPPLPAQPGSKRQAVEFEGQYCSAIHGSVLFPDFIESNTFVDKNGRNNMIIENDYLIKYKGFWSMDMVAEVYEKNNRS